MKTINPINHSTKSGTAAVSSHRSQRVLAEYPERTIPIYTELHELIEAVSGELKTYNDNGGGEDSSGAFGGAAGSWDVRTLYSTRYLLMALGTQRCVVGSSRVVPHTVVHYIC